MSGHGEKLSRKHDQAISALLTCASVTEAAAQCGVDEKTLRRWLQDETFQADYKDARRVVFDHGMVQVQQYTGAAVATLREVMQDPEVSPSARVNAAKAILEMAFKVLELESLESRLTAIEDHLAGPAR